MAPPTRQATASRLFNTHVNRELNQVTDAQSGNAKLRSEVRRESGLRSEVESLKFASPTSNFQLQTSHLEPPTSKLRRAFNTRKAFQSISHSDTPAVIYFDASLLNRSELRDSALAAISQSGKNVKWVITHAENLSAELRQVFARSNVHFAGSFKEAQTHFGKAAAKQIVLVPSSKGARSLFVTRPLWDQFELDAAGLGFFGVLFYLSGRFTDAFRKNGNLIQMASPILQGILSDLRAQFTVALSA